MTYHPNRSTHRALAALCASPMRPDDLRQAIFPGRYAYALSKCALMVSDGLINAGREEYLITDIGREALASLNEGEDYHPFHQTVRIFVQQGAEGGGSGHPRRAA